jgi:hypothetical protein
MAASITLLTPLGFQRISALGYWSTRPVYFPGQEIDAPMYIYGRPNIVRFICVAGCGYEACQGAHPNMVNSVVKATKYCYEGGMLDCKNPNCNFNHWRSCEEFNAWYRGTVPRTCCHGEVIAPEQPELPEDELLDERDVIKMTAKPDLPTLSEFIPAV